MASEVLRAPHGAPSANRPAAGVAGAPGRAAATFHGGAVLPAVEVQALYYGANWADTTTNLQGYTPYQLTAHLETELKYLVQSPFMDTLSDAGYGVGRGSFSQGRIYTINPVPGANLTDAAIRTGLQYTITDGALQAPDANRLYVVFVQPNVVVQQPDGSLSNSATASFTGYHGAFAGTDAQGHAAVIHYAVIPTPGGAVHNASAAVGLPPADAISVALTQQLADAVTDPNLGYSTKGWYNDALHADVAGVNAPPVRLKGYLIAQVGDPAGKPLAAGQNEVAAIAGAGVWRYEDATGWRQLTTADAAQAVVDADGDVAVEIVGHGVWRYENASGWTQLTPADATQIQMAGDGIVAAVLPASGVWRYVDAYGWQHLTPAVPTQMALDARGDVAVEITGHGVWRLTALTAQWAQLTTTDASQMAIADDGAVAAVLPGMGVWRYKDVVGWTQLTTANPTQMAMDSSGDVVLAIHGMGVWRYKDVVGWTQLTTAEATAVAISGNGVVNIEIPGAGVWRYEDELGWGWLTPADVAFLSAAA